MSQKFDIALLPACTLKSTIVSDSTIEKVIEHELEIKTGPFNELELDLVLKKLKNKKAAGLDGIPSEGWKLENLNTFYYIIVMKYTMEM